MSNFPELWATGVVLAVKQAGGVIENMRDLLRPLRVAQTGPIEERLKPDGKPNQALLLINTLGGETWFDQLASKLEASLIQANTQQAQMAGIQEQQDYDLRREAAKKDGTLEDPAASTAWYEREEAAAAQISDYQVRNARMSAIEKDRQDNDARVIKPVQDAQAFALAQELDKTRDSEPARNALKARVETLVQSKQLSSAEGVRILTTINAQGNRVVQSYRKEINKRVNDITKDFKAWVTSPNSYGREKIVEFEYQSIYNAESMAFRRLEEAVDAAVKDGRDPTEAMDKVQFNNNFGLRRREEVGGTQPPRYTDTTDLIKKNTGNWSRSTIAPREANELRSQAKVRPLMELEPWDRDVTSFLNGNPSQNFKTLLKTLTTGAGGQRPSEVILNQFRLLGIEVPENELQKIRALDGQEISRAPAPRRTPPQQNGALTGVQIAGRALGNPAGGTSSGQPSGRHVHVLCRSWGKAKASSAEGDCHAPGPGRWLHEAVGIHRDQDPQHPQRQRIGRPRLLPGVPGFFQGSNRCVGWHRPPGQHLQPGKASIGRLDSRLQREGLGGNPSRSLRRSRSLAA
jgi:hypothetical protein